METSGPIARPWRATFAGIADWDAPIATGTVPALLDRAVAEYGDDPAITFRDRPIGFRALAEQADRLAAGLLEAGIGAGQSVALYLPNTPWHPVAFFAVARTGARVVHLSALDAPRELAHKLADSGARVLITTNLPHLLPTALRLLAEGAVARVLVGEDARWGPGELPALPVPWSAIVTLPPEAAPPAHWPAVSPDDICVLQYTGGTTGVAKGAMLTHRNLVANMLQCKALMGANLNEGCEILIAPLPLYHIYAFTFHCMAMMLTGNHNILITNPRDLPSMLKDLGQWKFTGFVGLNTLFVALCNNETFRKLDFSALKLTLSGGMALQLATAERWKEVTGCAICEGYGMTETAPVVSVNPFQNIQVGTIGIPVPSTLCKVIGDDGQEVPLGERGELCVKGPQVMKGYWQRQEATDEILDADGWLKTGDIAIIQEDGYMRIVDRKKDMILVSGFNVYPNELEDVLATLPGVLQCAAIGIPDEKSGESIKVFVVVKPGATLTKEQVMQHMHDNLTGYKRPKAVEFRDSLPTTNVGKILRRELRDEELKKAGQK